MRHRVAHRKLGRVTEHRIALLRNQAEALLRHERIRTTVPKAKELRMFVEKIISTAKDGLDQANGKALHARRLVARDIQNKDVVKKLFLELAPRFAQRPGGYTRILRVGFRRGDAAEMAQVELVGSEFNPKAAAEKKAAAEGGKAGKSKGMGGRLRAAASRLRSRREKGEEAEKPEKEKEEEESEE